jgi:hypothetical protein
MIVDKRDDVELRSSLFLFAGFELGTWWFTKQKTTTRSGFSADGNTFRGEGVFLLTDACAGGKEHTALSVVNGCRGTIQSISCRRDWFKIGLKCNGNNTIGHFCTHPLVCGVQTILGAL